MAYKKIEAGQGGKLGHSNMAHYTTTEEIKKISKKLRREESKKIYDEEPKKI